MRYAPHSERLHTTGNYIMDLSRYTYDLPEQRIARHPLEERDSSRLLVADVEEGTIRHRVFSDIADLLPEGSMLVVNRTRVIAARLQLFKPTGGRVEVFLVNPVAPSPDPAIVLASREPSDWECLIGGRHVLQDMVLVDRISGDANLRAVVLSKTDGEATVRLQWSTGGTLSAILEEYGSVPLPPYLHRDAEESDKERYQTVFAREEGSVAAPTAGLHFTPRVMDALGEKGVATAAVTLHVGMGTFKPVSAADVRDHVMHRERIGIARTELERIVEHTAHDEAWITVVGTTSLRTLESVYLFGARLVRDGFDTDGLDIGQWDALDTTLTSVSRHDAFDAVLEWMKANDMETCWGTTAVMLLPGAAIRSCDALVTNFHQPGSTLLLLVAALCGEPFWRTIYGTALADGYRFLSYGDSSLIMRRSLR
ncbi:MAG: hypothetical protein BGO89_06345 [Candidatus Kapaibacterium thiocyanatum]|uniref:S-adenosylmethionine:tRNA ribosyltransferase-isomerase n=1 Tax=Candidatus Kapaibacterium thiocyanatum TaxID=1895771 RepID=A0A1M3KYY8_9BACT|nr:MAG: hypothetical protein BGO89_06345 ['Candidatus Kapabacteria' thiocyanatum]